MVSNIFYFHPYLGKRFPFWLIFFKSTNQFTKRPPHFLWDLLRPQSCNAKTIRFFLPSVKQGAFLKGAGKIFHPTFHPTHRRMFRRNSKGFILIGILAHRTSVDERLGCPIILQNAMFLGFHYYSQFWWWDPKGIGSLRFFCDLQRNQEFTDGFKDVLCLPWSMGLFDPIWINGSGQTEK